MRRARAQLAGVPEARQKPLGAVLKASREPMPWRRAVSIAIDIAEQLAEAEAKGEIDGPLGPDAVVVIDDDRAVLTLAASKQRGAGSLSPVWCPPAQADGAPFDAAANRYVLGLLLYKMLTGSHPFAGAGLRQALDAAARAEAPPFKPELAEALPPGLQSITLRLVHPDPTRRPPSAEAVLDVLARFEAAAAGAGHLDIGGIKAAPAHPTPVSPRREERRASTPTPARPLPGDELPTLASEGVIRSAREPIGGANAGPVVRPVAVVERDGARGGRRAPASQASWFKALLPLAIGAAVAAGLVTQLEAPAKASKAPPPAIAGEAPIGPDTLAASDCATCHARQTSEWRRSVMGHAVKSPLFNALEALIQEQVGRDFDCPNGAGILRKTTPELACRDRQSGLPISGSGGEHWCVNCHAPSEVLEGRMPPWAGRGGDPRSLLPVRDLIGDHAMEGISCSFCHQAHGPVNPRARGYQGNPTWTSFVTGRVFESRPEDARGVFGIANSGFDLQAASFLLGSATPPPGPGGSELVHKRPDESMGRYLRSSEFCGSCHDVRLFGSDVLGTAQKGEHFKRLRNGYSEWKDWAALERRKGREPATCQGCHMSAFPGVCEPEAGAEGDDKCPKGTRWEKRAPGSYPSGHVASGSEAATKVTTHYLTGVDLPLSREYPEDLLDESAVDASGIPISAKARRDALLQATFAFGVGDARLSGNRLQVPLQIENIGAGHRVPAGFSQEREIWVHLTVKDGTKRVLYEVGRVTGNDDDLDDKIFERVNTDPSIIDEQGRPIGLFGADVRDGPDAPLWSPNPALGGTRFVGRGLINFQNGFLRCVTCIGTVGSDGSCLPSFGQERRRADRFADGIYDQDLGTCTSNLNGTQALFETYFPVGALDSTRGITKAPDAIIDTRSMPPGVPILYTYDLDLRGARGPFTVTARLLFRAFPPYLIKAFAEYERQMARLGRRPNGPLVDEGMMKRLDVVEVAKVERTIQP